MQNSGNETSWNHMFNKYQETSLAQEKEKLLYGLASVRNITLLDRWFKHTQVSLFLQKQLFIVCCFPSSSLLCCHFGQITVWGMQYIFKTNYITCPSEIVLWQGKCLVLLVERYWRHGSCCTQSTTFSSSNSVCTLCNFSCWIVN